MQLLNALVITLSVLSSSHSHALNLGKSPESTILGHPLNILIPLEVNGLSSDQFTVKIAPADLHIEQNIDYSTVPKDLRVNVATKENDFFALVTTKRPINQPYIEFIIKLQSPTATLYKRYQLIVDPQTY